MRPPRPRLSEDALHATSTYQQLEQALTSPSLVEALFDLLDDVVFFVKDGAGRYMIVNRTLMRR